MCYLTKKKVLVSQKCWNLSKKQVVSKPPLTSFFQVTLLITQMEVTFSPLKRSRIKSPKGSLGRTMFFFFEKTSPLGVLEIPMFAQNCCQHPPWHSYLINREFGRPVLDAEVQVCHATWFMGIKKVPPPKLPPPFQ